MAAVPERYAAFLSSIDATMRCATICIVRWKVSGDRSSGFALAGCSVAPGCRRCLQQQVASLTIRFPTGPVAVRRLPALPRLRQLTIEAQTIDLDGIEQLAAVTDLSLTGRIVNAEKLPPSSGWRTLKSTVPSLA